MHDEAEPEPALEDDAPPPLPKPPRERWFGPYRGLAFRISFKWLAAGAAVYALLLLVAIAGNPDDVLVPILGPSVWLTPVYGLPLLIATPHRPGRTRRLIYFLLLVPLAHMAANYIAWAHGVANYDPATGAVDYRRDLACGALGGLAGSVLSFTALYLIGLTARRRAELAIMMVFCLMLTLLGAAGMALGLIWSEAVGDRLGLRDAGKLIIWYETVHLPWQLAFAAALGWLMRPIRARKAKPAPEEAPEAEPGTVR